MPIIACPNCGEDDDLTGDRAGETITLTCGECGLQWDRDTEPECALCGSSDVEGVATSTLQEHGRANVRAPSGIRLAYYCWDCRGRDVTSSEPQRGPYPPPGTSSRDLKTLRSGY